MQDKISKGESAKEERLHSYNLAFRTSPNGASLPLYLRRRGGEKIKESGSQTISEWFRSLSAWCGHNYGCTRLKGRRRYWSPSQDYSLSCKERLKEGQRASKNRREREIKTGRMRAREWRWEKQANSMNQGGSLLEQYYHQDQANTHTLHNLVRNSRNKPKQQNNRNVGTDKDWCKQQATLWALADVAVLQHIKHKVTFLPSPFIKTPPHIQIAACRRRVRNSSKQAAHQAVAWEWLPLQMISPYWIKMKWYIVPSQSWRRILEGCSLSVSFLCVHIPAGELCSLTYSYVTSIREMLNEWKNAGERAKQLHEDTLQL